MNFNENGFRPDGASGVADEPRESPATPEERKVPEFMAEVVEQTQEIINAIEACRDEQRAILEMVGRFVNGPDHRKACTREVLLPLSTAKDALNLRVNELTQEARMCLRGKPQAKDYLKGPEEILQELA